MLSTSVVAAVVRE
jgi:hypothetical protein